MTDTPEALPPLPEPEFINNERGRFWGFTADQMRDYARAALAQRQQVPLPANETPEMHDAVMSVLYNGGITRTRTNELWQAYRGALLAAAPALTAAPSAQAELMAAELKQLKTECAAWKRWCEEAEAKCRASVVEWAVARWKDEVEYRPMANKNRRTLDDTWRQVIRFGGSEPNALIGPSHDELMQQGQLSASPQAPVLTAAPSAQAEPVDASHLVGVGPSGLGASMPSLCSPEVLLSAWPAAQAEPQVPLTDEQIEEIARTVQPITKTGQPSWEHAVIRAYEAARGIGKQEGK